MEAFKLFLEYGLPIEVVVGLLIILSPLFMIIGSVLISSLRPLMALGAQSMICRARKFGLVPKVRVVMMGH